MGAPFDRDAAARLARFSSAESRTWGVSCSAHDLIAAPARRVTYEQMPPRETEMTHLHDRAHQVFHVLTGTLLIDVRGETFVAHQRDTIEIPPGTPHRALTGDEAATFIVFSTPTTAGDRREVVDSPSSASSSSARARRSIESDVAEVVRLRRLMFEEMGFDVANAAWEISARDIILRETAAERMIVIVIDSPSGSGELAASGVVQFEIGLPLPGDASVARAYISSMSTDREWRGRGFATEILAALLAECEARGVEDVRLHATEQGRPIYEKRGFRDGGGNPEMHLVRPSSTPR